MHTTDYEQFKLWRYFKWQNTVSNKNKEKASTLQIYSFRVFFPPLLQMKLCIPVGNPPVTGSHSVIIFFRNPSSFILQPVETFSFHKPNMHLPIKSDTHKYFFLYTITPLLFGHRVPFSLFPLLRVLYNRIPWTSPSKTHDAKGPLPSVM